MSTDSDPAFGDESWSRPFGQETTTTALNRLFRPETSITGHRGHREYKAVRS